MIRFIPRFALLFVVLGILGVLVSFGPAEEGPSSAEDEQVLHDAGLSSSGSALLVFFQARARTEVERQPLHRLLIQCVKGGSEERTRAMAELLGLGPLALPVLRQAAGDLDHPDFAERASRCLPWLEGPASRRLLAAAARMLARRKPEGAASALLAFLPLAEDAEVIRSVNAALADVAMPNGKLDPALLRCLADPLGVRRAAAGVALSRAMPPEQMPAVHKLLKDPSPSVRLRTALALAESNDEEAIPVLIDLLAELPAEERVPVEEFLTHLAGEWAPAAQFHSEDKIGRRIRRDAWASWWRNADAESLLAAVREHTLTSEGRVKIAGLIAKLNSEDFALRENASKNLFALGRISLPQLRDAAQSKDAEMARRARQLIERIEHDPIHHLPAAAVRLLAVRKPPGSVEALLGYLPFAEDEMIADDTQKSLTALAQRDGKPHPALLRALQDKNPTIRATIAEVLVQGGGPEGRAAARKLLADDSADVRLRVALTLAKARDRDGVPVLIDLLTVLPLDQAAQVEDSLHQLAGDTSPDVTVGQEPAQRKKCRDAWVGWWKVNAGRVDLARLTARPWYGFTLIVDLQGNRVFELDRKGNQRWLINNAGGPTDARILPGNRVLIAEYGADRVTERDFSGKILWEKHVPNPVNAQRLDNGNTFVATFNGPIFEFDRSGNEVLRLDNPAGPNQAANRTHRGNIIALSGNSQCCIMDATGRQLKQFAAGNMQNCMGGIDVTSNGRIIVAQQQRSKLVEFDSDGKQIVEVDAPNIMSATGLPNGHFLVAAQNAQRVFEVDRTGKVVWEYGAAGQVARARRR
ncbi:MAG: HEAT repeat domain-containing protein [Gemmataceae bacterium]